MKSWLIGKQHVYHVRDNTADSKQQQQAIIILDKEQYYTTIINFIMTFYNIFQKFPC